MVPLRVQTIPCRGAMDTTAKWPPPPPSIASDTTSASPRDPTSAGRWPGPHSQYNKSGTTLGSKVNPRSTSMVYYASPFLRRMYHTSAHGIPCEQGDNACLSDCNCRFDGCTDGRGWSSFRLFPCLWLCMLWLMLRLYLAVVALLYLSYAILGWGGVHYCFTS